MGREILRGLLADNSVSAVHTLGRRALPPGNDKHAGQHAKLTHHIVDFASLPVLPAVDEVYLALGTTIKVAGSQQAFRAVDFEANMAVAKACRANGTTKAGAVCAMGADSKSAIFYNRVKGELEDGLAQLGFATLVIARPSMLDGDREALGQPVRGGEKIAADISRWLSPLIPDNYKSIPATSVARALLTAVPTHKGQRVMLSGEMRRAGAR